MHDPVKYACERYRMFLRDVVAPSVIRDRAPLTVEAYQCEDPIPVGDAARATFAPVDVGWKWGPRWSTCWFRVKGNAPFDNAQLRFSTDVEALVWRDGVPWHGLDVNRDVVPLWFGKGDEVELLIEGACNHPFGADPLQWDGPEEKRRWTTDPTPARLDYAELVTVDETVWRLRWTYAFALDLLESLDSESPRAHEINAVMRRVTAVLPDDDVPGSADEALRLLEACLHRPAASSATRCTAVGHAHIDTAWLWPLRETRRKCLRTFANVLRIMEKDSDFRFVCTQPVQYEMVMQDAPALFEQIKQRVAEGRWEPGGAMWVEPDCNIPSPESLIRQIQHGVAFFEEHFGDKGKQRCLFLPDTFGFPPTLPQIMRQAGLDTFITNKLSWNTVNEFPHTTFIWRGIDGSEVLAHFTPGHDYNATNTPKELIRGVTNHKTHASGDAGGARWLQPFGFGDGGGGPTDWQVLYARLASDCDGLPRVTMGRMDDFCESLHEERRRLQAIGEDFPAWEGELYLELHRGTYTTQSWLKRANRKAEEDLRFAEMLVAASPVRLTQEEFDDAKARLDEAWKLVLLNQFHDILPGSSIKWVYDDAKKDFARVEELVEGVIREGMERWGRMMGEIGDEDVTVASHERNPIVVTTLESVRRSPNIRCVASQDRLWKESDGVETRSRYQGRLSISPDGWLGEEGLGLVGQLMLFEDRPRMWDAWDLDAEYLDKPVSIPGPDSVEASHTDDVGEVRVTRSLGRASRVTQVFSIHAEEPGVTIETIVDWHEDHRVLRMLFDLHGDTRWPSPEVHCDVGTGKFSRPVGSPNVGQDVTFEFPAQRGVSYKRRSLSSDRSSGYSCRDDILGVTLLRSPTYPDPTADRGRHVFRHHFGQQRSMRTRFDQRTISLASHDRDDKRRVQWSPLCLEGNALVEVMVMQPVTPDRFMLRIVNPTPREVSFDCRWQLPVTGVGMIDFLGRFVEREGLGHDGSRTSLQLQPSEIVTLLVDLDGDAGPLRHLAFGD